MSLVVVRTLTKIRTRRLAPQASGEVVMLVVREFPFNKTTLTHQVRCRHDKLCPNDYGLPALAIIPLRGVEDAKGDLLCPCCI